MTRRAYLLLAFLLAFTAGLVILLVIYVADAKAWTSYPANRHIYNSEAVLSGGGTITDRSGVILAQTVDGKRVYNSKAEIRKAVLHMVGDSDGFIKTGLQSSYWEQLVGYNLVNGVFQPSGRGNDIATTLDANLSATALKALGSYKGTVGVYNYKTGEVLCMVSSPTFDVNSKPDVEGDTTDKYTGVYLNRFLSSSYPPGSTFKLVTAAAALESQKDMDTRTYTCKRGVEVDGEWISCLGNHGKIGFKDALAQSCNAYFAQLAISLGPDTLTKYAEKMGFNQSFSLDGIAAKKSTIDFTDIRRVDLGWAGMGQYTNLANPLHFLTMMGAIANGGVPVKPYFIGSITTPAGLPAHLRVSKNGSRMLSADAADTLKDMIRYTVTKKYGDATFPGLQFCAKTGTAEVGAGIEPHAWIAGFSQDEKTPLAIVVVAENGGLGIGVAGKIANTVLQQAKKLV